MTTADMDGDGRSDLVLVDGTGASVRVGYQLSAGNLAWAAPRTLGMEEVTDISCGRFYSMYSQDLLVATAPALNRYNLYYLPTAADIPVPQAAYAVGTGPQSIVAMDIGGAGNTAEDDLFSVSIMNGSAPFKGTSVRSDGTAFSTLGTPVSIGSAWKHLNRVEYATGREALGIIDAISSGVFRLYDLSSGGISHIVSMYLSMPNSPAYVSFIPAGDSLAQFLVWEPGSYTVKAFSMTEPSAGSYAFSSTVSYDLGSPIDSIQLVRGGGTTRLAVFFKNGQTMAIFDYDGTSAPVHLQDLSAPVGELLIGALPMGSDDFAFFTSASGDFSGAVTVDRQHFSGGQFSSVGTVQLAAPSIAGAAANVMTFEGEPLVDNTPRRLQLLRGGDWADDVNISAGQVSAIVETDSGVLTGLGNPQVVGLGAADPAAAYTLANQLHAAIAVFSFDAARGEEVAVLQVFPDPGTYGTSIEVSLSATPAATLFYRTDSSSAWTFYSAPFALFADTDVQYYALVGTKRSIIHTAAYRFSETPSDLDSDGDGVPDYVELANGLDPLESGLDADGDGYSDLDELLAGSDPLFDGSIPASSNRVERSSVYDLVLTPFAYDGLYNTIHASRAGTQVRLFNAAGGQRGFAKTTVASYPPARFEAVPLSFKPPFMTATTDLRFDVTPGTTTNQLGVELVGIYLQPTATVAQVAYTYQGGDLATEAANWLAAAQSAYTNDVRDVVTDNLGIYDTLAGLLVERKLSDLLYGRGTLSTNWVSLFKGRTPDQTMAGFSSSNLQSLETTGLGGEPAYHLPDLISFIQTQAVALPELRELTRDVYDICSTDGRQSSNAGKYPLPLDVLRSFLFDGTMHSNYLANAQISSADVATAYTEATQMLAQASSRPLASFTLEVRADSFDVACPVLYTGASVAKSLYDADGNPFRFPTSFTLQPGAQVSVEAFTDPEWSLCPGTDPLEVISLSLVAVPTASGSVASPPPTSMATASATSRNTLTEPIPTIPEATAWRPLISAHRLFGWMHPIFRSAGPPPTPRTSFSPSNTPKTSPDPPSHWSRNCRKAISTLCSTKLLPSVSTA